MVQVEWGEVADALPMTYLLAAGTFVAGLVLGYVVSLFVRRLLVAFDVDQSVEGTAFERTARGLGTSTVGLLSQLVAISIYTVAALMALSVVNVVTTRLVWAQAAGLLPRLFVASLAVILGLVVGDKVSLYISERLKSVKLPDIGLIPAVARYSVIYVALLVALGQLGIAVTALIVLLAIYALALVFLCGLAFKDLMAAGAAGIYLLVTPPYGIGDQVRIDGHQGIVQEVDMFTTRIESDSEEFIIPNHLVMRTTVARVRD